MLPHPSGARSNPVPASPPTRKSQLKATKKRSQPSQRIDAESRRLIGAGAQIRRRPGSLLPPQDAPASGLQFVPHRTLLGSRGAGTGSSLPVSFTRWLARENILVSDLSARLPPNLGTLSAVRGTVGAIAHKVAGHGRLKWVSVATCSTDSRARNAPSCKAQPDTEGIKPRANTILITQITTAGCKVQFDTEGI